MALNYTELKAAIQDYLEVSETSFVANLDVFIRQAEDRILKDLQLPAFRKIKTATQGSGNKFMQLPSGFLAQYALAMISAAGVYSWLYYKAPEYINEMYQDDSLTGVPVMYGLWDDNTMIIGPRPDANYTAELHYLERPESIITAATTWLGTNAEMVLLSACVVEAYLYLKGEADLLQAYEVKYQSARDRLKNLGEGITKTDEFKTGQHSQAVT